MYTVLITVVWSYLKQTVRGQFLQAGNDGCGIPMLTLNWQITGCWLREKKILRQKRLGTPALYDYVTNIVSAAEGAHQDAHNQVAAMCWLRKQSGCLIIRRSSGMSMTLHTYAIDFVTAPEGTCTQLEAHNKVAVMCWLSIRAAAS